MVCLEPQTVKRKLLVPRIALLREFSIVDPDTETDESNEELEALDGKSPKKADKTHKIC